MTRQEIKSEVTIATSLMVKDLSKENLNKRKDLKLIDLLNLKDQLNLQIENLKGSNQQIVLPLMIVKNLQMQGQLEIRTDQPTDLQRKAIIVQQIKKLDLMQNRDQRGITATDQRKVIHHHQVGIVPKIQNGSLIKDGSL